MELKVTSSVLLPVRLVFQSHLYGIESILYHARTWIATKFQSHLYGIERWWRARRSPALRCFNRTFMELKVSWAVRRAGKRSVSIAPLWNWKTVNRMRIPKCLSFNRTFMELKVRNGVKPRYCLAVSIAPLWNWKPIRGASVGAFESFNRTFMELKVCNLSR